MRKNVSYKIKIKNDVKQSLETSYAFKDIRTRLKRSDTNDPSMSFVGQVLNVLQSIATVQNSRVFANWTNSRPAAAAPG